MAFFNRIKKTMLVTFILTALMTLSANAYDVKGGEIKVGSSLNLRSEANTSASVVTQIPNTHRVAVLDAIEGWYKVAYNGQNGYVSADYVELSDIMNVEPGAAKVTTDVLNVRSTPSTSGDIVTRLSKDATAKIIGINSGWFKIEMASGATPRLCRSRCQFDFCNNRFFLGRCPCSCFDLGSGLCSHFPGCSLCLWRFFPQGF